MSVPAAQRSPRVIAAVALVLMFLPSALLAALGWQLYQQDRHRSTELVRQTREQTADLVVAALAQRLDASTSALASPSTWARFEQASDAAVVTLTADGVLDVPVGRLAYSPAPRPGRQAPTEAFFRADMLWAQGRGAESAVLLRRDAGSADPALRAGALLRLARGRSPVERLAIYDQLAGVDDAAIEGVPADLFARDRRCEVLESMGRSAELRQEASSLLRGLASGQWSIGRAVYEANVENARRRLGPGAHDVARTDAELLATVVESLATNWPASRDTIRLGDATAVVLWTQDRDRRVGLVALSSFAEREWVSAVTPLADRQGLRMFVRSAPGTDAGPVIVRRDAAESGLPWTLMFASPIASADPIEDGRLPWIAGVASLILLLAAGAFLVIRAVGRELVVARLQSDFVAAVSHEFRTPLTSVRQLSEILIDGRVAADDERQAYYRAIFRQADRLQRLVENLLDFTRFETGSTAYRLQPVDLVALTRSVVEDFERQVVPPGVQIEITASHSAVSVDADHEALTNAIWNLLDNAVKYSPPHPTVRVDVDAQGDDVLVRVRDWGMGIPPEERGEVFDRFVRGARAKAEGIIGTGIGLAMVRHIVRAHRGRIDLESEPGAGSTFTIVLPRGRASAPASTRVADAARGNGLDADQPCRTS